MDPRLSAILERLRDSRLAEVKGARASLSIPVPESLLNELIAAALPASGPIRDLHVRPQAGNRLAVRGRAVGMTARFVLDFATTGELQRKVDVRGRLLLTRTDNGWKVFGYDVNKDVARLKGGTR